MQKLFEEAMSLRQHGPFILGAVASVAAGAGLCVACLHIWKELRDIRTILDEIKRDVDDISDSRFSKRKAGSLSKHNYITASSGDDDEDDFQDAIGGYDGRMSRNVVVHIGYADPTR